MRNLRISVVLLLLVTGVGGSLCSLTATLLNAQAERPPAGCHEHGKKVPVRQPANYACCVSGHGFAIPQASGVLRPSLQPSLNFVPAVRSRAAAMCRGRETLADSMGSPPGRLTIRV